MMMVLLMMNFMIKNHSIQPKLIKIYKKNQINRILGNFRQILKKIKINQMLENKKMRKNKYNKFKVNNHCIKKKKIYLERLNQNLFLHHSM